jgi:hypothetical protein
LYFSAVLFITSTFSSLFFDGTKYTSSTCAMAAKGEASDTMSANAGSILLTLFFIIVRFYILFRYKNITTQTTKKGKTPTIRGGNPYKIKKTA